jgi:hypothetical protein
VRVKQLQVDDLLFLLGHGFHLRFFDSAVSRPRRRDWFIASQADALSSQSSVRGVRAVDLGRD